MKNGKGYLTDNEEMIKSRVESHMKPFVETMLMGQERTIRKIDEVLSIMKVATTNRVLIWILGFVDLATLILIFLHFQLAK